MLLQLLSISCIYCTKDGDSRQAEEVSDLPSRLCEEDLLRAHNVEGKGRLILYFDLTVVLESPRI